MEPLRKCVIYFERAGDVQYVHTGMLIIGAVSTA